MVSQEEIKVFQWIEVSIKNEDKKVGTFEWPDTSWPERKIGDGDNDKDKEEVNEKEKQDDEADSSSDEGMIELKSKFQNYSNLEAYETKSVANNKQRKVIVRFQDHAELNLTNMLLQNNKNAKEGSKIVEKQSAARRLFGNGPEK